MKRFAKTTRGNVLSKHTLSNNNFIQYKAVHWVLSLNIHFPFCKLKNYLLLFYKIQLPRHDSVDEIAAFDIWAVPTAIGIRGMSNIFSAAIYVKEFQELEGGVLK